ncbi:MAG: MarR family winged helix-turn-helix transcriptional regulator [Dehalococcoidia bacterium]
MTTSSPNAPNERLRLGQLLVRLLHRMRSESFNEGQAMGANLRFTHLQVIGNLVGVDGIRLTELASRATLSLAACSEQVNELETLGYLERRPDPTDGRAKLIVPTARGRRLLEASQASIARLEERWAARCAPGAFEQACSTLDQLLRSLDEADSTADPDVRPLNESESP